eukprot:TRINITY_DN272_c0_g2_i1.p1 TRINITY_DN272_c0_g2~~TRINITY_DN272_c0_g2_i1.p1  ORF type:complete len:333 (+),score=93.63 TRINITY_DN272_c0_g2_i1:221-1219(+)
MSEAALAKAVGGRAPKTHRGRRLLKKRESKIVEDARSLLVIRGQKCSNDCTMLLRDLHKLRSPLAGLFMRKHQEHPFEDATHMEQMCVKHDHSLFAFGSTSKKRPFRLILGRLFDNKLLDMQEFGVSGYKPMSSFHAGRTESSLGSKPLVIFQGAAFETNESLKRTKSLLMELFGGPRPEKILLSGVDSVVVCTTYDSAAGSAAGAQDGKEPPVDVRRFKIKQVKSGARLPRVELEEMGPRLSLEVDRQKGPDKERWKQAMKVPKAAAPAKVKNVSKDSTGKRKGRIHLGKQLYDTIHTVHHGEAKRKKKKAEGGDETASKKAKVDAGPSDA